MENNFLAQYLPIVVYTPILLENHWRVISVKIMFVLML